MMDIQKDWLVVEIPERFRSAKWLHRISQDLMGTGPYLMASGSDELPTETLAMCLNYQNSGSILIYSTLSMCYLDDISSEEYTEISLMTLYSKLGLTWLEDEYL
jgi:hypothetical protein